jgi:isoaspartyl peptidase/L-asparaginase-like protein (Ntn-hydrolase superfamily)
MSNCPFGLVIHGGAGVIVRPELTPELETQYRTALAETVDTGYAVLERGGSCLDAVVAAIKVMEDSPLFNAGHGAVMNAEGVCELDASIMDGRTLDAGAYAKNATCALSATGHGEFFIRSVFGHNVSALMEYKGLSLQDAAAEAVRQMAELGGTGGLVAIDRQGRIAMPFNTPGMYRGSRVAGGPTEVAVFGPEA